MISRSRRVRAARCDMRRILAATVVACQVGYTRRLRSGSSAPQQAMHPGALKALEFDRIVASVTRLAQTPPGAERLTQLGPAHDPDSVSRALALTSETARFLSGTGEIALRAPAE